MYILGIETSCDDTAAAVIEVHGGFAKPSRGFGEPKFSVLANTSYSQVAIHKKFGGIVPNLASRAHLEKIIPTIKETFKIAKKKTENIDLIAVTKGPGLLPSLLIGVNTARALAYRFRKPIIGVNHIEGHIYSNWLTNKKIESPALILVVSGGHTELVLMSARGGSALGGKNSIKYKIIGQTLDDAAGECFDKTARLLELGFPGGPAIAAAANKLPITNYKLQVQLPRPMINSKDYNFSFSGLKTAVLYLYNDLIKKYPAKEISPAIAAEVQNAIIDVLTAKTVKAIENLNPKTVMIAGGVSANKALREKMVKEIESYGIPFLMPDISYATDNAAMIAVAGYFSAKGGSASGGNYLDKDSWKKIEADANLKL
ncbi:MAG: tRNA (adenosine(37)-N6)-threonylcarbamoyltransferase complex transferase subunit TsaD [Candidatus Azambacteria bacterium]|nr:tRNA (adenosine(37)-N6)-threonylcarbamoyltransferase complex transferase subunit TsaD [Candidatus Azambacteria bacterium]